MGETAGVVICGAGIAGIAAAYHLTLAGVRDVLLIEAGEPLSLTSDKSTECYRNFWPGPGDGMVRLMNRSIDLLETLARQSGDAFHLNRRGYLYGTAHPQNLERLKRAAMESSALGAGPVRIHRDHPDACLPSGPDAPADGFDLLADPGVTRGQYPWLSDSIIGALHVRRAGWFSAQQLGRLLLDRARAQGATLMRGEVQAVGLRAGHVESIRVAGPSGPLQIAAPAFVNAAGPWLGRVARGMGIKLPVYCERHAKVSIPDPARIMPRGAPLVILDDPQMIDWAADEQAGLRELGREDLLHQLPSGVHARPEGPEGSPILLALWPYHRPVEEPSFPLKFDELYPEIVLRGLERLLPASRAYRERMPRAFIDGGYYTRTPENRPLIGPLEARGAFVIGALSGFGLMAAMAAGELLAAHVTGAALPDYARWFAPARYADPAYRATLPAMGEEGQL